MSDLATVVVTETAKTVIEATSGHVSAHGTVSDPVFFLWLVVPLLTALSTSQYATIRDKYYHNLFDSPIKPYMIMLYTFGVDILMSASIIFYMWNFQHPVAGERTDRYISIMALWFTLQGIKAVSSILFWVYGEYIETVIASLIGMVIIVIICIVLFFLFVFEAIATYAPGNEATPLPAILMVFVGLGYLGMAIFNGCVVGEKRRNNKREKELEVSVRSEKDQQMLRRLDDDRRNGRSEDQDYYSEGRNTGRQQQEQYYYNTNSKLNMGKSTHHTR